MRDGEQDDRQELVSIGVKVLMIQRMQAGPSIGGRHGGEWEDNVNEKGGQ